MLRPFADSAAFETAYPVGVLFVVGRGVAAFGAIIWFVWRSDD